MYNGYAWSLEDHKNQLRQCSEQNQKGAQGAWNELEKSVAGHLTDDVKVSILDRTVEMTIAKKLI